MMMCIKSVKIDRLGDSKSYGKTGKIAQYILPIYYVNKHR